MPLRFVTGANVWPGVDWEISFTHLGISFCKLLREYSVLTRLEVAGLCASSCHVSLEKAAGFQVNLHLARGLIWSSLTSGIFFFFNCVNSQNPMAKTRDQSKTINLVHIFRMLRCFIWKQSKTEALQRLLRYPRSKEKLLLRILVCGHKL